ncbi:Vacuolar iron transporter like 4 [Apostasia shenzhenica]|uniref:Vacuolar iron transporter n=1 Tax=Apostasia shenzhenica TaxID=1088818 RepID=A0A2I0AD96_9ASPA|nr:Vacuolar iron transporter like 4 [Apostasia shenzhenica]
MASSNVASDTHAISLPRVPPPSTILSIVLRETELPPAISKDYSARAQWLRAAVLGANDGLVSVASIMIGVGAVNQNSHAMLISGLAGLIAGASSMAVGEFVSVYTQYDIELAQMKRENITPEKRNLPSPSKAAAASGIAFTMGAVLPLLAGAFIDSWVARVAVVSSVSSVGLVVFGAIGAFLGGAAGITKSAARVLVGGWTAMLLSYGVLRLANIVFNININDSS